MLIRGSVYTEQVDNILTFFFIFFFAYITFLFAKIAAGIQARLQGYFRWLLPL